MTVNRQGGILRKTGLVWMMALALSLVFNAGGEAAPAMPVKQSSTKPVAKTDPGEWKKVVEAAKKEGKLVLSGQVGEEWRKTQVDMFRQEYPEITVEFSAGSARDFWPRIKKEREFGKKLWDLRVSGGVDPLSIEAKRNGVLAPLRPLLLPEIADDNKWLGGLDGAFVDREKKYIFGYTLYTSPTARVNRDFIKESDLKSSAQLVDPKFKGKIVILTPTGGASAQALGHMAFMYGENFIRELLSKQDVIITDDNRQQVEWVVRGKYPITTTFAPTLLIQYVKQGLGRNIAILEDKTIRLTTGSGTLFLLEGAPHPNAAKVFVNWLLTKEGQEAFARGALAPSRRLDVSTKGVVASAIPKSGRKYLEDDEESLAQREKMAELAKNIFRPLVK